MGSLLAVGALSGLLVYSHAWAPRGPISPQQHQLVRQDAELRASQSSPGPAGLTEKVSRLERRVRQLEGDLRRMRTSLAQAQPTSASRDGVRGAKGTVRQQPEERLPGADARQAPSADGTARVPLTKKLSKRIGVIERKIKLAEKGKKPGLDDFATTLGLDENQKVEVQRIVKQKNQEMLDLLMIPSVDGTVFGEEVARLVAYPESTSATDWQKLFGKLMSSKMPGTRSTYLEALGKIEQTARQELGELMNTQQRQDFQSWKIKPTDIQIEGNPWNAYIQQYKERFPDRSQQK
jgi:hypothetical protein